jgi:hypothetical protein
MLLERLNPARQAGLGDAYLIPDHDIFYVATKQIVILGGELSQLPQDVVEWMQAARLGVDWRFLFAREVDVEKELFLPANSQGWEDIFGRALGAWWSPDMVRRDLEKYAKAIQNPMSLRETFETGEAFPLYADDKSQFGRAEGGAAVYRFEIFDGGSAVTRILALPGSQFRTLVELGFDILAPLRTTRAEGVTLGLRLGDLHTTGSFGVWRPPFAHSGLFRDSFGRDIYDDAAEVSWRTIEEGLAMLRSPYAHDPVSPDYCDTFTEVLASTNFYMYGTVRGGIGVLRWNGMSEEDIESIFEEARVYAWKSLVAETNDQAEKLAEGIEGLGPSEIVHPGVARKAVGFYDRVAFIKAKLPNDPDIDIEIVTNLLKEVEARQ